MARTFIPTKKNLDDFLITEEEFKEKSLNIINDYFNENFEKYYNEYYKEYLKSIDILQDKKIIYSKYTGEDVNDYASEIFRKNTIIEEDKFNPYFVGGLDIGFYNFLPNVFTISIKIKIYDKHSIILGNENVALYHKNNIIGLRFKDNTIYEGETDFGDETKIDFIIEQNDLKNSKIYVNDEEVEMNFNPVFKTTRNESLFFLNMIRFGGCLYDENFKPNIDYLEIIIYNYNIKE